MKRIATACLVLLCAAAAALGQPVVTANGMVNAASAIQAGLPNGNLAQGSIFSIYGQNMGPAAPGVSATSFPLPTTLSNVSVNVKDSAGANHAAILFFVYAGQINALLPSATATGQASLTVTYNNQTSAPQTFNVVAKSVGLFARNAAGSGPGVVQQYHNGNPTLNDITNSAYPGDVAVLWGTGLGPITGDETEPPKQVNLGTPAQVWVGGQQVLPANIAYEGRSPDAGLDQINFTIPASAPQGCYVPVSVIINGIVSNTVSVSIMPNGGMCSDPLSIYQGLSTSQLQQNGLREGIVSVSQSTASFLGISENSSDASGTFDKYNWTQLAASRAGGLGISVLGACTVFTYSGESGSAPDPIVPTFLDAGTLTLTTPSGAVPLTEQSTGVYSSASGALPYPLAQGSYTVTASGGANVGAFTSTLKLPAPFTWTNMSSIISTGVSLSQGVTVTWSGGSGQYVEIAGDSGVTTPQVAGAVFYCLAPVSAGTFTVPPNVLLALPPSQLGALIVANTPVSSTFNPNPPSGLDVGSFSAGYTSVAIVSYQ